MSCLSAGRGPPGYDPPRPGRCRTCRAARCPAAGTRARCPAPHHGPGQVLGGHLEQRVDEGVVDDRHRVEPEADDVVGDPDLAAVPAAVGDGQHPARDGLRGRHRERRHPDGVAVRRGLLVDRGVHATRRDVAEPDPGAVPVVDPQLADQPPDAPLAQHVRRHVRHRDVPDQRPDQDEAARLLVAQHRQHVAGEVDRTVQVRGEDAVEDLGGDVLDPAVRDDPRVADHDVDPAVLGDHLGDGGTDVVVVPHVRGQHERRRGPGAGAQVGDPGRARRGRGRGARRGPRGPRPRGRWPRRSRSMPR